MRKFVCAFVIVLVWQASAFASPSDNTLPGETSASLDNSPVSLGDPAGERAALQKARAQFDAGNSSDAGILLSAIMAAPSFNALTPQEQYSAWSLLASVKLDAKDYQGALAAARQSSAAPFAGALDWGMRMLAACYGGDKSECVLSLTSFAQKYPDKLSAFDDELIWFAVGQKENIPDGAHLALVQALYDASWNPKDPQRSTDWMNLDLATSLVYRGENAKAAQIIQSISTAEVLARIIDDKRFDAAVALDQSHYDIASTLAAEIAKFKAMASQDPNKLGIVNSYAEILRKAGKTDEALSLLDGALARIQVQTKASPAFSDEDDNLNWTKNARAEVLWQMGRFDQARAAMAQGATLGESGQPTNVSQAINLSENDNDLERPQDALNDIAGLDEKSVSPYGLNQVENTRACAYAQLHDSVGTAAALNFLKAHVEIDFGSVFDGLLCSGDEDGAASLLIAQLDDLKTRSTALYKIQTFFVPEQLSPGEKAQEAQLKRILARADVKAEIAKVGRINSYPFY